MIVVKKKFRWHYLVLVCLLSLFVFRTLGYLDFTIDDTYISLVYVRNLIQGNGLTFNGMRVEGYSNFLFVLLTSAGSLLFGADPVLMAKGLSLSFGIISMILAERLVAVNTKSRISLLVILWLASNLFFVAWSIGGLEITLYTCLVLAIIFLYARSPDGKAKRINIGILLGFAALTRPEGFALIVMLLAYIGLKEQIWQHPNKWNSICLIFAGWLFVVFPFWVFRLSYYGHFWPAPVYAKIGDDPKQVFTGLHYAWKFLQASWYWPVLGLVCVALYLFYLKRGVAYSDTPLLAFWLSGGLGAIVILSGGDWMPAFRLLVPLLPLLYLVIAVTLDRLLSEERWAWRLAGFFLGSGVTLASFFTPVDQQQYVRYIMDIATGLPKTGLWLAQHANPNDLVAVVDAGAIPYYSGLPTLDMVGLNDYHIAKQPGRFMFKHDVEYVLAQKPMYIQMHIVPSISKKGKVAVDFIGAFKLYYHPEFQRWYDPVSDVPWTQLFKRRETPRAQTWLDRFFAVQYEGYPATIQGAPGMKIPFEVRLTNTGSGVWTAGGGNSGLGWVRLGYQFLSSGKELDSSGPIRVSLPEDLAPGESAVLAFTFDLPKQSGFYELKVDLVLEGFAWFSSMGSAPLIIPLSVLNE